MSNRVQGARLKAAAAVHARKQLSALGVGFYRDGGSATFTGKTAFAAYTYTNENVVKSFRINYPELADNALVSRREADLISAYTLHEIGHVAFTANNGMENVRGPLFYIWNGIEDARIERAVISSGKARGSRTAFKRLMSKFTATVNEEFNPTSINCAPFALALICRAALGDGNGFAKTLLSRIPEPKRSLYATVANAMSGLRLDREGSLQALELARNFLSSWDAIDPIRKFQPTEQPSGAPQSSDEPQQSDEQPEQSEQSEPSWGEGTDDSDDDFDADDNDLDGLDDLDDIGDLDIKPDDDSIDMSGDISSTAEELPEGDSSMLDMADDGDDPDGDGDDYSPTGSGEFKDTSDSYDEQRVMKPEPDVSDLFEAINQRTRGAVILPDFSHPRRSDMTYWPSLGDRNELSIRRTFKQLHKASLPALKAQLYRLLKAPERCGWDGGALGGRFDGKRSARMMAGSEAVFKRRWLSDGIDTAISVIVDLSGSMKGESIKESVDLAWTIAEAAESAGADVEVTGFSTQWGGTVDGCNDLAGNWVTSGRGYRSSLVIAKRFNQRCANVAHHFTTMKRVAAGGTPDYECVRSVCESLSMSPAKRKLVIVITDGFGDQFAMAKLTRAAYDLYGVDIIGFGINCSDHQFRMVYECGSPVSMSTLHKSALKSIARQLESRDTRRVA